MKTKNYLIALSLVLWSGTSQAEDFKWSELRVFTLSNTLATAPTALNNLTAPDNVDPLETIYSIGIEADARWKWIKIGTRFTGALMSKDAPNSPMPPTAYLTIGQYSGAALARVPLIEKDAVNLDVLAEVGAANTAIDVRTNSSGKADIKCEACVFGRVGASLALGWPTFKISIEGGQEFNNLTNLKTTGTLAAADNISSIDLSGTYIAAGIVIYGIPSWIKPGSITTK